ncbi:MAG: alanine--tRNA ligase, partial [Euryarchaeota archaeon HGW-Euryarchaeota-1]
LRQVLGNHIEQRGSNITPERLRFDFSHPQKMTEEEKQAVETLVNKWIEQDLEVVCEEMSNKEADEKGVHGIFKDKYEERVKVYTIGDVSCEKCGGPHVKRTGELGKFKIKKEQSISAGVRRIKAVLE